MRVAFTGHRQLPCTEDSEKAIKLKILILREIWERIANHADTFLCGGATGADILCGEMVLDIRQSRPDIKLICAIPFREFAEHWSAEWKERYEQLLMGADRVFHVSESYHRGCYHQRNRYLVDNCDVLIAVYNGTERGGTAYTVKYARQRGKEIVIINPDTLTRTVIATQSNI